QETTDRLPTARALVRPTGDPRHGRSRPCRLLRERGTEIMTLGPATSESDRLTPVVDDEAAVAATGKAVEGRSLSRIAWNRLKKDRVALAGGVGVLFLVLVALFAPLLVR